jgi:hypothetical protein
MIRPVHARWTALWVLGLVLAFSHADAQQASQTHRKPRPRTRI